MTPFEEALRAVVIGGFALLAGSVALPRDDRGRPVASMGAGFALGACLLSIISLVPLAPSRGAGGFAWLVLAVGAVAAAAIWRATRGTTRTAVRLPRFPRHPRPVWLALALFGVAGGLLHVAFAFQTRLDYDELSYHLPLATHFAGAFSGEWPMFYGRLPMLVPSLSRFACALDGAGTGPAVLHGFAIIAGAGCTGAIAARLGARRVGRMLAAVLYIWHPMVIDASSKHLSDPWVALFSAAACEQLLASWSRGRTGPTTTVRGVLFALFCGAAPAAKLGALGLVAAPLGLLWGGRIFIHPGPRPSARAIAAMAVAFALPLAIWFAVPEPAKSGYPSSEFIDRQRARVVDVHHPQTPLDAAYWTTASARIGLPGYTLADIAQPGVILDLDLPPLAAGVSFLFLASVGSLLSARRGTTAALLAAALAAWLTLLLVRDNPGRFWIGSLPWLCGIAGAWVAGTGGRGVLRALVRPLLAAALAGIMAGQWRMIEYRLWVPDRAAWKTHFAALGPGYAEALLAAQSAQESGRVLVLFDGRNHLFGAKAEPVTAWDPPPALIDALSDATDGRTLADGLRARGFTHLFVNEAEFGRILAFYARARLGRDPRGIVGTRSQDFASELQAFPAFDLVGISERDARLIADLLRTSRPGAVVAVPAGPTSEIWLAPIPAPASLLP